MYGIGLECRPLISLLSLTLMPNFMPTTLPINTPPPIFLFLIPLGHPYASSAYQLITLHNPNLLHILNLYPTSPYPHPFTISTLPSLSHSKQYPIPSLPVHTPTSTLPTPIASYSLHTPTHTLLVYQKCQMHPGI